MYSPKYKLRFNLQHGKHYKHWQITNVKTKMKEHYNPNEYMIIANDCKLVNKAPKARLIHEGKTCKDVCAWVECRGYKVLSLLELKEIMSNLNNCILFGNTLLNLEKYTTKLCYNPIVNPYWTLNNKDNVKCNVDNLTTRYIVTIGNSVYTTLDE